MRAKCITYTESHVNHFYPFDLHQLLVYQEHEAIFMFAIINSKKVIILYNLYKPIFIIFNVFSN